MQTEGKLDDIRPINIESNEPVLGPTPPAEDEKSYDAAEFEWEAADFIRGQRGNNWMLLVGLVFIAVIGYSVYTKDWFMIPVAVIAAVILYFYSRVSPTNHKYRLTNMGLYVDDHFYPFNEMRSFWMVFNQSVQQIHFEFLKRYLPAFSVHLSSSVDPYKLKLFLKRYLPEQEKRGEPYLDKLLRILKI